MQIRKLRNSLSAALFCMVLVLTFGATTSVAAERAETQCKMIFNLSGWSILYESASGTGSIKCDNGQSSVVNIQVKGGGITAG